VNLLESSSRNQTEPPAISIDRGRQLFIDDELIEFTSLNRTFHKPVIDPRSPVLKPETPLELNNGVMPATAVFSDGLWYDPKDRLFKLWYMAGYDDGFAYAFSEDGIDWIRPSLDIAPGTNRILPPMAGYCRNGSTVWLDHDARNPAERFKMFVYFRRSNGAWPRADPVPQPPEPEMGHIYTSPDGISWTFRARTGPCGDNTGMFYNPLARKWMFSVRTKTPGIGRTRSYFAHADFVEGASWTIDDLELFAGIDSKDRPDEELGYRPELYKADCVAYESIMIGLFGLYYGPPNHISYAAGIPKTIDLFLATSRDGFTWQRPDRSPFLACSRTQDTWNKGYLHAAGGVCLIVGDELRFYHSGFSGKSPAQGTGPYADVSIGFATLRRDGFASMDGPGVAMPLVANAPMIPAAVGDGGLGMLVTRPVVFSGNRLFVNAKVPPEGRLRVAVLDASGAEVAGFGFDDCIAIAEDSTRHVLRWREHDALDRFGGTPVRFAFRIDAGELYAFWVSPDESGASSGFVAAGGPGFLGATDTTGA
jgi:hypothetical protein